MNFKYYHTERLIPFTLVLSVLCIYLADLIDKSLVESQVLSKINHLVHTFSTLSLMIVTFLFINYLGWKLKLFKWLIDIPNLNGRYCGEAVSTYKDPSGNPIHKACVLEIKQNASSIHIFAYFGDVGTNLNTSSSHSVSEYLVKENNGFFKLYYIFTNESNALQLQLNNHLGTARFNYYPDTKTLDGDYYNQRMNTGTIIVKFEQEELLGRLTP